MRLVTDDDGRRFGADMSQVMELLHIPKSGITMVTYRNGTTTSLKDRTGKLFENLKPTYSVDADKETT